MERVIVIDIGSSRLKTLEYIDGIPGRYQKYGVPGYDGILDAGFIKKVVRGLMDGYDLFIITGQRASIVGWEESGEHSDIYTWRSGVDENYRNKYLDPEDYMLNLFIRPGSGALRIKYLQDSGFKYVGGVESFVAWLLAGEYIVDYSYAYPYGLLDPFEFRYMDYLIEKLELDLERIPRLVDSYRDCLSQGIPILMIPDQSASLVSEGFEVAKATLGTGAFIDVYTGNELIGDPDKGVNPMLSLYIDGTPYYMAEGFIFDWGVSLDHMIKEKGFSYNSLDEIRVNGNSYKVYTPLLRSTFSPTKVEVYDDYTLRDVVLSLVGSVGMFIEVLREIRGFDEIYLDGGGARLEIILEMIAKSANVDVIVRSYPEKASLFGGYLYYLLRLGDGFEEALDIYRPVIKRFEGSNEYNWIVDVYREEVERVRGSNLSHT